MTFNSLGIRAGRLFDRICEGNPYFGDDEGDDIKRKAFVTGFLPRDDESAFRIYNDQLRVLHSAIEIELEGKSNVTKSEEEFLNLKEKKKIVC